MSSNKRSVDSCNEIEGEREFNKFVKKAKLVVDRPMRTVDGCPDMSAGLERLTEWYLAREKVLLARADAAAAHKAEGLMFKKQREKYYAGAIALAEDRLEDIPKEVARYFVKEVTSKDGTVSLVPR